MRRFAVLLSIALLAGALLARRRRRKREAAAPFDAPGRAERVAAPASGTRFVSVPWTLVAASAEEPRLTIRHLAGEHLTLDRLDAQETPTQVFVTVLMRWQPPAGGGSPLAQEREVVVPLAQPLGERELVHAPVDLGEALGADEPGDPPLYP